MIPRGAQVLIVDNDADVTAVVEAILAREGCAVEVAHRGDEGLARLEGGGTRVDLVVLDLRMPGLSGFDLLHRLELLSDAPPVVVVSGFVADDERERLLVHPLVRAVLKKPFDLDVFRNLVAGIIAEGFAGGPSLPFESAEP